MGYSSVEAQAAARGDTNRASIDPFPGPPPQAGEEVRIGLRAVLVLVLVGVYRATIGRFLGGQCRFDPSCSQYMIDSVRKHGVIRGGWRGLKRIVRCNPLFKAGYDPA